MNDLIPILGILAVIVLIITMTIWHFSRSRTVLEQWADENGYQILHSEYRNFMKGPFFWTTSEGQTVYHVTVRLNSGEVRTGWVKCGGWMLGLWSDKAEVRWD